MADWTAHDHGRPGNRNKHKDRFDRDWADWRPSSSMWAPLITPTFGARGDYLPTVALS
jgi:hypothetical protein